MQNPYDFPAAVKLVGPVRQGRTEQDTKRLSCSAIKYAVKYKRIVKPREYGRTMLFTAEQIEELKKHFRMED